MLRGHGQGLVDQLEDRLVGQSLGIVQGRINC